MICTFEKATLQVPATYVESRDKGKGKGYDIDPQGHPDIEQSKYAQSYVKIFQQYKKYLSCIMRTRIFTLAYAMHPRDRNLQSAWQPRSLPSGLGRTNVSNKCKNEVGYRDDTVPKTVDTRRHCEEE